MSSPSWHTVSQTSQPAATDVNQYLVAHSANYIVGSDVIAYSNSGNTGASGVSTFLGWVQLSQMHADNLAISFSARESNYVAYVPITYTNLKTSVAPSAPSVITNSVAFSAPCDLVVSYDSKSYTLPGELIAALASTDSPLPQYMLPAHTSIASTQVLPSPSTVITSVVSGYTFTVADATVFPASGKLSYYGQYTAGYGTLPSGDYSFKTSGGFDAQFLSGVPVPIAPATVSLTPPPTLSYFSTSDGWAFCANLVDATSAMANTTYIAKYSNNSISNWVPGPPLPEYDMQIAYAPATTTFYAVGPSGTVYSAAFDNVYGTIGAWSTFQLSQLTIVSGVATTINYTLPPYNLAASDSPPALCVATIDGIDYLFMFGGVTNNFAQNSAFYVALNAPQQTQSTNSSVSANYINFIPTLPCQVNAPANETYAIASIALSTPSAGYATITTTVDNDIVAGQTVSIYGTYANSLATVAGTYIVDSIAAANQFVVSSAITVAPTLSNATVEVLTPRGMQAFYYNNAVYVRDFNNQTVSLYSIPVQADTSNLAYAGILIGQWSYVGASQFNATEMHGVAYGTLITNRDVIALSSTTLGSACMMNNYIGWGAGTPGTSFWDYQYVSWAIDHAAVFTNIDGTACIISTIGVTQLFNQATWLPIPVFGVTVGSTVTLSASSRVSENNRGVNIAVVSNNNPASPKSIEYTTADGVNVTLSGYDVPNATNGTNNFVVALADAELEKFTLLTWDHPSNVLLTIAEFVSNATSAANVVSQIALQYNGLGGIYASTLDSTGAYVTGAVRLV